MLLVPSLAVKPTHLSVLLTVDSIPDMGIFVLQIPSPPMPPLPLLFYKPTRTNNMVVNQSQTLITPWLQVSTNLSEKLFVVILINIINILARKLTLKFQMTLAMVILKLLRNLKFQKPLLKPQMRMLKSKLSRLWKVSSITLILCTHVPALRFHLHQSTLGLTPHQLVA